MPIDGIHVGCTDRERYGTPAKGKRRKAQSTVQDSTVEVRFFVHDSAVEDVTESKEALGVRRLPVIPRVGEAVFLDGERWAVTDVQWRLNGPVFVEVFFSCDPVWLDEAMDRIRKVLKLKTGLTKAARHELAMAADALAREIDARKYGL